MEIPRNPILQMQLLQALTLSMEADTVMEIVDNAPEIAPLDMILLIFRKSITASGRKSCFAVKVFSPTLNHLLHITLPRRAEQ